jgi:hypothetical protein
MRAGERDGRWRVGNPAARPREALRNRLTGFRFLPRQSKGFSAAPSKWLHPPALRFGGRRIRAKSGWSVRRLDQAH